MSDPRSPAPAPASRNRRRGSGGVRPDAPQGPRLFSRDPAERNAWLAEQNARLNYYTPPELRPLAQVISEMGPAAVHQRMSTSMRDLVAPDATLSERLMSGADLALETSAVVAAPLVLGRFLNRPASEVSQELLLGMSVSPSARGATDDLLAPPPQTIDVPPQQLAPPPQQPAPDPQLVEDLSRILRGDMPTGFGTFDGNVDGPTFLRLQARQDALRRGDYDDMLSEEQLRASLQDLLDNQAGWDVFGDPAEAALIRPRMEALQQRFPDVEPTPRTDPFEQVPFDPNQNLGPDIDDLLPADPVPDLPGWDINWDTMSWDPVPGNPLAPPAPDAFTSPYAGAGTRGLSPEISRQIRQQPQTWLDQGIAGLYSRSARAGDQLRAPRYSSPAQLRAELEGRGAPKAELDLLMERLEGLDGFVPDFTASAGAGRPRGVTREEVQQALREAPGWQLQRTGRYAERRSPRGGQNYTSTVYTHPSVQQGPSQARRHFGEQGDLPPLLHTRAAQYDLHFPDGGTTHHVVEIQSDWGQHRGKLRNQTYDENSSEVVTLRYAAQRLEEQASELRARGDNALARRAEEGAASFNRQADELIQTNPRAEFDALHPAPYIRNENDWVDAGVRQNLVDAVNSGSDWITFGNGSQAHRYIDMPLRAAEDFYNTRVPRRINEVLRRLARENEIDVRNPPDWWPQLQEVPFVDGETVRGFRISPEFRELLTRSGLPSFRDGGLVSAGEDLMSTSLPPLPPAPTTSKPQGSTPTKPPAHRFERVWDPARGREVTRIVSSLDTRPSAR